MFGFSVLVPSCAAWKKTVMKTASFAVMYREPLCAENIVNICARARVCVDCGMLITFLVPAVMLDVIMGGH